MKASEQCIKTSKCGNDGQNKEQIMERFVKFIPFLPHLTVQYTGLGSKEQLSIFHQQLYSMYIFYKKSLILSY